MPGDQALRLSIRRSRLEMGRGRGCGGLMSLLRGCFLSVVSWGLCQREGEVADLVG